MRNALRSVKAVFFMGCAIYCSVAYWFAWPLTNIVWFGTACGFAMASFREFAHTENPDE